MKSTQSDHNLDFNGMKDYPTQHSTKYSGNQYAGRQNPNKTVNMGRGPTRGNHGTLAGASCTPPVSAVPTLPAQGSVRDNINRGGQVRNPGGTREFAPAAGQNYRGNADAINVGRGPTKGNQC